MHWRSVVKQTPTNEPLNSPLFLLTLGFELSSFYCTFHFIILLGSPPLRRSFLEAGFFSRSTPSSALSTRLLPVTFIETLQLP